MVKKAMKKVSNQFDFFENLEVRSARANAFISENRLTVIFGDHILNKNRVTIVAKIHGEFATISLAICSRA